MRIQNNTWKGNKKEDWEQNVKLTNVFLERRIINKRINYFQMGVKNTTKIKMQESDPMTNEVLTVSDEEDKRSESDVFVIADGARNNNRAGI